MVLASDKIRNEASFQQGVRENLCYVVYSKLLAFVYGFTWRKKWDREFGAHNSKDKTVII